MKDYWIGLITAVFVLIFAAAVVTVNAKYEENILNFSDNNSTDKSDISDRSSYYYNDACWYNKSTNYSNITYRENIKCEQVENSSRPE